MRFGGLVALVMLTASLVGCGGGGTSTPGVSTSTPTVGPTSSPTVPPIAEQFRVACVGDSITLGSFLSKPTTDSYPAVLGRWLGGHSQVQNFGVASTSVLNSGSFPYQRTTAFTQAVRFKPNVLIVALGTNDRVAIFDSATKANFESDYKTLIDAFKAANPQVKVYTCLPPPSYGSQQSFNDKLLNDILPLIREVALFEDAQVIDFNTLLSNHAELFPDELHPSARGARLIAGEVYRVLTGNPPPA